MHLPLKSLIQMKGFKMNEIWEYLENLADEPDATTPHLGTNGDFSGIVFHKNFSKGQIVSSNYARQLGAQLILQADLHDEIYHNGATSATDKSSPISVPTTPTETYTVKKTFRGSAGKQKEIDDD